MSVHPAHLPALSVLLIDEVLATPLHDVLHADEVVEAVDRVVHALTAQPQLPERVAAEVASLQSRWREQPHTLGEMLPRPLRAGLLDLVATPWSPSEALVLELMDHPAARQLMREVLQGALERFAGRLKRLDEGMLGGLGGRAARRGKGLFSGVAGTLGSLADGVAGAVREELSGAVEERIRSSLGTATEQGLQSVARFLADPAQAEAVGSMRARMVEHLLDLPPERWADEASSIAFEDMARDLQRALHAASQDGSLEEATRRGVMWALELHGEESIGAVLDRFELRGVVHASLEPWLTRRLAKVTARDDFRAWWALATATP